MSERSGSDRQKRNSKPVASIIFIEKRARLDCNKKYKINEISACNYDLTVLIYLLHGKKSGAENKKL